VVSNFGVKVVILNFSRHAVVQMNGKYEFLHWRALTPRSEKSYLELIKVNNVTAVHASTGFDPRGIDLSEITDVDPVDETPLILAPRWKLGCIYPSLLIMTPTYTIEGLD
jgi:hypothetical protein